MGNFGLVSSYLPAAAYWKRWQWIPEGWRYRQDFAFAGKLSGYLGHVPVEGWGWSLARGQRTGYSLLWKALEREWTAKEVDVVGVDGLSSGEMTFPSGVGFSDGKSLELLLFAQQFKRILRHCQVNPQTAEIGIIWEEGNLGLVCARLIAQHIRFLRLIHPDAGRLDHAAAVLLAETGISPKIQQVPPDKEQRISMIIQCGLLNHYRSWSGSEFSSYWELFTGRLDLFQRLMGDGFFTVWGPLASLPASPVLGEVLIRAIAGWSSEQWVGTELRFERILLMKEYLDQLGVPVLSARLA